MIKVLSKLWRDRRGNMLVLAGAAMPLVLGSVGLATDTIQWALWKRQLQRSADSAALAGVYGKLGSQTVTPGACSASPPIARDLSVTDINTRLRTTPSCSVQAPPTSGAFTAATFSAVRVTLSTQRALPFSGMFMAGAPTITATATAALVQSGVYCLRSLKNDAGTGLGFSGSAVVNLKCGGKTNAKGANAIDGGGASQITMSPAAAVGQIANGGNFATGTTFQPFSYPEPDPFASVNPPTVPNGCNQSAVQGNQSSVSASNTTVCYKDLTLTSGQTATFTDAIVILNGGDLTANAGATINCTRCTFVLTTDSNTINSQSIGKVTFNGGATINLSPPTSGTYKDIVIYKDRRAPDCNNCNKINGNSSSSIAGAIYIPSQEIQFSGNGGISSDCVQMVGWTISFTGNSSISNECPSGGPKPFDGSMVRLVE